LPSPLRLPTAGLVLPDADNSRDGCVAALRLPESVDRILQDACGVEFTGAVARVELRGKLIFERAYGVTRADELGRPVYADTLFDLASLTKLFVTTLALQAVAARMIELDEPLSRVIPEWSKRPHAAITLRMLLAHTSGMNSGADYRAILDQNVEAFALGADLIAKPGERVIYSDLGFIALGVVLERTYGRSLAALARASFAPTPVFRPSFLQRLDIPATEDDGWRGRVQGFVHDEKAYLMGGVAGHAGLFGTAADVAALTESYLGPLRGRRAALLPRELAHEATSLQADDPVLRRGLGWALKTTDENSCGRWMDFSSFGHTGFVGTCVWADPVRDLQGVLLTNGVYFGRADTRDLRASFYEGIVQCAQSD
jgi:CubicO group peptidase (beta-lactamase class C family)